MAKLSEVHFDNDVMRVQVRVQPESAEFAEALKRKVKLYASAAVKVESRLDGGDMVVDLTLTPKAAKKARAKGKAKGKGKK